MKKYYTIAAELMETMKIQINDIKLVVKIANEDCFKVQEALTSCKTLLNMAADKCKQLAKLEKDE